MASKHKWPPMPEWWPSPIPYPPPRDGDEAQTCRIVEAQLAYQLPENWAVEFNPRTHIATIIAPNGEMAQLQIVWMPNPTPKDIKALAYDLGMSKP